MMFDCGFWQVNHNYKCEIVMRNMHRDTMIDMRMFARRRRMFARRRSHDLHVSEIRTCMLDRVARPSFPFLTC